MNLYKTIWNDINIYILKNKKIFLIPVLFLVQCYYIKIQIFNIDNTINGTLADYIFFIFKGNDPIIKTNDTTIPVFWISNLFLSSYITVGIIQEGLTGFNIQILLRSQSKYNWWLSKCITILAFVLIYFMILHLTIVIFCCINNIDFSFQLTDSLADIIFDSDCYQKKYNLNTNRFSVILISYIMPFLSLVTLNILQLFVSLRTSSIISFIITNIYILFSVYTDIPIAFAGYAMLQRSSTFVNDGMNIFVGVFICLIMICLSTIFGGFVFKSKDAL